MNFIFIGCIEAARNGLTRDCVRAAQMKEIEKHPERCDRRPQEERNSRGHHTCDTLTCTPYVNYLRYMLR